MIIKKISNIAQIIKKYSREIIFVFLGIFIGIILAKTSLYFGSIIESLATLIAAYVGASLAFNFQNKKQDEDIIKTKVKAGNKALFELIRTYNKFVAIRNDSIEPLRDNPLRHYLILPITGINFHETRLDFDSLDFLLETDEPDFLGQLSMFELEANSTIDTISQRFSIHFNHIQPSIEKISSDIDSKISADKIDEVIGHRYKNLIITTTNDMIKFIDNIIDITPKYIEKLNLVLKKEFPGHGILKMEIPNKKNK